MKIKTLKEKLKSYNKDLIVKIEVDNEVIDKITFGKMYIGLGIQNMHNDYPYACIAITVDDLLNELNKYDDDKYIIIYDDITDAYDTDVTIIYYDIIDIIIDNSIILKAKYKTEKIY